MSTERGRGADLEARAAALGAPLAEVDPSRFTPMLCERAGAPLAAPGWIYELKLDGVRIVADVRGGIVKLFYRKARETTSSYPEVCEALAKLDAGLRAGHAGGFAPGPPLRAVLDGEIVTFDAHGRPSFERLGQRFSLTRPVDVKVAMRSVPVVYVVFDLLAIGGRDLRPLPLLARKELLRELVPASMKDVVRVLDHVDGDGRALFELCEREKLEGIIAKRADGPWRANTRSPDWVKKKREQDDDFVVIGWTRGKDGGLGALDLATYDGDQLRVRGEVGSGIDRRTATKLLERFEGMRAGGPTAVGEYETGEDRTHLLPEVVVRVRWHMWSESGRLRFPVFLGVREDADPRECTVGPEAAVAVGAKPAAAPEVPNRERERVVRPAGPHASLLPYVVGRPLAIARTASDETAPTWTPPKGAPSWIRVVDMPPRARARRAMVIDGIDALEWLAAHGATAFFVAAARESSLDLADWLAVDLDARAAPPKVFEKIARATRAVLDDLGLPAFAMTLGKDSLRVLAPLGGVPWEGAGALAELVVRAVVAREPKRATNDAAIAKAGGRVLLDASPSLPYAALIAPWSLRASGYLCAPVEWSTLVPAASSSTSPDPMLPLLSTPVDYPAAVQKVSALFR